MEAVEPEKVEGSKQYWQELLGEQYQDLTAQQQLALGKGKRKRAEVWLAVCESALIREQQWEGRHMVLPGARSCSDGQWQWRRQRATLPGIL